jgi:hypothetical protein
VAICYSLDRQASSRGEGVSKRRASADQERLPTPASIIAPPSDAEAERISLLHAAVKLNLDGLSHAAIALALGVPLYRVQRALRDPRAAILRERLEADAERSAEDRIQRARAEYLLNRAVERLEAELDSRNEWLAHQSALALIAMLTRQQAAGGNGTEIIVSPGLAFDDQADDDGAGAELQEIPDDDADLPDMTADDAV